MELDTAYYEVKKRLDLIDFGALWEGFTPLRFALYNDKECFFDGRFIEKTDAFIANTAIEFNGEQTAIWNMTEQTDDMDRLASKLAHEMFHGFQNSSNESRWADERAALFLYRYSAENVSIKLREAALMRDIIASPSAEALSELLSLRRARAERFPYEYDYEARTEQTEGSANYVELKALSVLAPEKAAAEWERILEKIGDPAGYAPIRVISYYTGAAFLRCLSLCGRNDFYGFGSIPFSQAAIEGASPASSLPDVDPRAEESLRAFNGETERMINDALERNDLVLEGAYPLAMLNVYNARRLGAYVTSSYYISYFDGEKPVVLYGDFVAETDEDFVLKRVYRLRKNPE